MDQVQQSNPPQFTENFEWNVEPKDILGVRWNTEWIDEHHSTEEATWEGASDMKKQFPDLHLEDKVLLKPGGIVRPPIMKT